MKTRILVLLLSLTLLVSCTTQETEFVDGRDKAGDETVNTEETERGGVEIDSTTHSMLCMVFLGEDEKANADMIAEVTKLRESLQHRIHPLIFTAQSQQEKAVQDIITKYNVSEFPAVIIDGRLLTEEESLEQAAGEAASKKTITIDQHLVRDIIDEGTLVATFYVCCYEEGEYIEGGRVMVYAVERNEDEETYLQDVYEALIADSKEYYVESGSCHVPEMVYWQILEDTDPDNLYLLMVVYDSDEQVLGTFCSLKGCEQSEE